jgi:hypothetical protein
MGSSPPDQSQGTQGGRIMSVAPEELLVAASLDGWLANPNMPVP